MARPRNQYYLIEEYEYDTRVGADTRYDVRMFTTLEALKRALLEGPQNKGRLIPTKRINLDVVVNESL